MIEIVIASSIMLSNNVLSFGNIDINTALFDDLSTVPAYQDPGSKQWGAKIANNTGYNNRHSDQNLVLVNDQYTTTGSPVDKTFDAARNYIGKYISAKLIGRVSASQITLPFEWDEHNNPEELILLTTTFQTFAATPAFSIRAENSGGITLRVDSGNTLFVSGRITELRLVTGS